MREPGSGSREVLGILIVQSSETSRNPCDCPILHPQPYPQPYTETKKRESYWKRKKENLFSAPNPPPTNGDAFLFPLLSLRSFADERKTEQGRPSVTLLLSDLPFSLEAGATESFLVPISIYWQKKRRGFFPLW